MSTRKEIAGRALSLIDLTNLNDDCTPDAITELCERARTKFGNTAAVCVFPDFVVQSKELLSGSGVKVATVINFPSGGYDVRATMHEAKQAVANGADEIDLVLPYTAFKNSDAEIARTMVSTIQAVTHNQAKLKVIIESGKLVDPTLIKQASLLSLEEGADFIKTSTGKVETNATLEAAEIMLTALAEFGDKTRGFKPAGSIKTVEDCGAYLDLADRIMGESWASAATFRFGASGVLDDVLAALEDGSAHTVEGY
jgi:deoxyribose-phosphate aldolase